MFSNQNSGLKIVFITKTGICRIRMYFAMRVSLCFRSLAEEKSPSFKICNGSHSVKNEAIVTVIHQRISKGKILNQLKHNASK